MSFFYQSPLIVVVPLTLVVAIGLAIAGVALLQRGVDRDALREGQEVAGAIYAVIGTIYAVIIAFVVVVVWEQFNDAERVAHEEASHVGNLRHMAMAFPDTVRREIEFRTANYLRSVIAREWPAMSEGHEDPQTVATMHAIWHAYNNFRPAAAEQAYYSESIRELNEFNSSRRMRILDSREKIQPFMWAVLLAGAVVVIGFTYLFATSKQWNQYVTIAGLTAMITLTLIRLM